MIPAERYASPTEKRRRFRARLATGKTIWAPGIYDALSAKLADQAGLELAVVAGFAVSASLLGQPDAEIYSMTEVRDILGRIIAATTIPIMADGDNGFGNAVSVMRTVQEFEAAGASSITIEDQASPKRCPMIIERPELVPFNEAVGKIRAAVEARRDPETLIIARTDTLDIGEAIERCCAYAEAGADLIKPIWNDSKALENFGKLRDATGKPLSISVVDYVEEKFSKTEIEEVAAIATVPVGPVLAAAKTLRNTFDVIRDFGYLTTSTIEKYPVNEFKKIIGFDDIESYEDRYLPRSAD